MFTNSFYAFIVALHTELVVVGPDFFNFVAFSCFIVAIVIMLSDQVKSGLETTYLEEKALLAKSANDQISLLLESVEEEMAVLELQKVLIAELVKASEKTNYLHSTDFIDQAVFQSKMESAMYEDFVLLLDQHVKTQKFIFSSFRSKLSKKPVLKK